MTGNNDNQMTLPVVIIGCGDIGRHVAHLFITKNRSVCGLVRSQSSVEQMKRSGIVPVQADLDDPETLSDLSLNDSLLYYFAPPPASGVIDTRISNFLASLNDKKLPMKIIYISTSGVYGDQAGRRVTEKTRPCPGADRSRRRLNAEQQLTQFCSKHELELIILRVSGIYGPGRLPVKRIQDRIPVLDEELAPKTSRIHAEDLVTICLAAAEHGLNGEIYNISDGCDTNMTQYFFQVADHLNLPRPPTINWQKAEKLLSNGMLSYLRESRLLDNSKMLKELKVKLKYPNLRQGLSEMAAAEIRNRRSCEATLYQ